MKKAQITIFIIAGLLLVIGVATYLYMTQKPAGLPPGVLEAPEEIRPVVQFTIDCLNQAGQDGLIRIAAGGGYIDARMQGLRINALVPTESDAITFSPTSQQAIPYWWYLKSPNNCKGACEFSTQRPPLLREGGDKSIENQLDVAVAQRVEACVSNFTSMTPQGFSIITGSKPTVTTTIGTTGVTFFLNWKLIVSKGPQQWNYDTFGTHVEVPLNEMYNVASELAQIEAKEDAQDPTVNSHYLEKHIMQVIDSFTGLQDNGLPPVAYATFELDSGKRWVKEDVHRKVRDLITAYVPMLQVWGTSNYVFKEAPATADNPDLWSRLYNLNMLIALKENHPDLEIRFSAPDWWREYFELNCRGQVCAPDSFVNTFGFPFGFQKYNFAYSMSVPVLVEIRDRKAFAGKGYTFTYALEANIRDNEPMPFIFQPHTTPDDTSSGSMLCDPGQRTGSTLTIKAIDSRGNPVLTPLVISFSCGDEGCAMGSTEGGVYSAQFPRCAGATISAVSQDRYGQSMPVNTHNEDTQQITVVSDPIITLNADVQRVQFIKASKQWIFNPTPLAKRLGDQAIIMLSRNGADGDLPFASAIEICGNNGGQNSLGQARLVPGNYSVNIVVMYHYPLVFPPQKRCVATFCYSLPETPLTFGDEGAHCDSGSPMIIGTNEFNWELTPAMLASGNTIRFKALVAAIDMVPESSREIEDMSVVSDMGDYSLAYQQYLQPEVVLT